jgi:outer membrane lipoprotein-sorting protein
VIAQERPRLLVLCVLTALLYSCSPGPSHTTNTNPSEQVISATPPFRTKEPDTYRALRTTTFINSGGLPKITKTLVARDGAFRREESDELVVLDTDKGRFLLLPQARIYAEAQPSTAATPIADDQETDTSAERLLHQEAIATKYEKLGVEVVSGRNVTKYRVTVNISGGGNVSTSETLLWIDEKLGMPIKSDAKGNDGSQTLMELSDILLDVDKTLFQIPPGYEKVAIGELRQRLRTN